MIDVHVTDLNYTCRRRFVWGKSYDNPAPSLSMWLGTLVHEGLAYYYQQNRPAVDEVLRKYSMDIVSAWVRDTMPRYPAFFQPEGGWFQLVKKGHDILQHYLKEDKGSRQLRGDIIAVEERMSRSYKELDVTFTGKIDLVLERHDGIYIIDHKVLSPNNYSTIKAEAFLIDDQLTAYSWFYWKKTGIVPRGVIYNILFSVVPEAPKLLKKGGLSRDKTQHTTVALYLEAIQKNGLQVEDYTDYLEQLRASEGGKYFLQITGTRSKTELQNFEDKLHFRLRDIADILTYNEYAWPSKSFYKCRDCPFIVPCGMAERGEDYMEVLETFPARGERI